MEDYSCGCDSGDEENDSDGQWRHDHRMEPEDNLARARSLQTKNFKSILLKKV